MHSLFYLLLVSVPVFIVVSLSISVVLGLYCISTRIGFYPIICFRSFTDKDDVIGAAQNLSASGEEVSASVEEVTATMEEQSGMTEHLAEMVQTIDGLTKQLAEASSRFKTK
ncbi:hypothetical protein ACX12E_18470 [Paenibacillus vandeheii]